MSVINKVLQDLDKRQQPHQLENVQILSTPSTQPKQPATWFWVFGIVIVAAVFTVYQLYPTLFLSTESQTPIQVALEKDDTLVDEKQVVAPEVVEPKIVSEQAAVPHELEPVTTQNPQASPLPIQQTEKQIDEPEIQPKRIQTSIAEEKPQAILEIKPVELTPKQLAEKYYKQGESAITQGQVDNAIAHFQRSLSFDNSFHPARKQLAALYFGRKQNNKAMTLLQSAQQQFPQYSEYSLMLAKIDFSNNQYQSAMQRLANIPDSDELAPEKWMQLSTISQQQQDHPIAVAAFKKLTVYRPREGRWWLGLGFNLDAQQQYVEARVAYQHALDTHSLSKASIQYIQQRLLQISEGSK
ncbi:tetratricopeptide repeat protein [Parashewanella spongiae]|nr:tetratricopeptide repeat protein [Parashewanella spongiae]MCL1078240.1 tetratricopeptide repeat protein [Parashewanella spongiae]